VMWRQLLEEQIAIVEAGGEPINVYRDPQHNELITFSATRVKAGDRYVSRDSEEAQSWQEYRPGSHQEALARREAREAAASGAVS
jgi:hypothetical protein